MRTFPPLTPEGRALEHSLRRAANRMTESQRMQAYALFSQGDNEYTPTDFTLNDTHLVAAQGGETFVFPRPLPLVKYFLIVAQYRRWLLNKYTLPGFVDVEDGDNVLDCGAYVGGFAFAAMEAGAGAVTCVEPAPENAQCVQQNLNGWPTAKIIQCGLYNKTQKTILNLSPSAVEHSILTPDDGVIASGLEIDVFRLDDFVQRYDAKIDFLKVEAEGVEPEILEGLGDLRPTKIAIDVSPERDQKSPAKQISKYLASLGYVQKIRGNVLFAKLQPQSQTSKPAQVIPPRRLFSMWVDIRGADAPPAIVQTCLTRWKTLNPAYDMQVLNRNDVMEICSHLPQNNQMSIQARSDVVRHWLLAKHGGVWTDATVLPMTPLDDWMPKHTDISGFFGLRRSDREQLPHATWMVGGTPMSLMTQAWWRKIRRYWQTPRVRLSDTDWRQMYALNPDFMFDAANGENIPVAPYFWSHHLLKRALAENAGLNDLWNSVPRLDVAPAIHLQKQLTDSGTSADLHKSVVHKMDHRTPYADGVLDQLLHQLSVFDQSKT